MADNSSIDGDVVARVTASSHAAGHAPSSVLFDAAKIRKDDNAAAAASTASEAWLCDPSREPKRYQATLDVRLKEPIAFRSVEIGNAGTAFVEVLVGTSKRSDDDSFDVLVAKSSFMSPLESKHSLQADRARFFAGPKLNPLCSGKRYDLVRIVCTQPYNQSTPFGLRHLLWNQPKTDLAAGVDTYAQDQQQQHHPLPSSDAAASSPRDGSGGDDSDSEDFGKFHMRSVPTLDARSVNPFLKPPSSSSTSSSSSSSAASLKSEKGDTSTQSRKMSDMPYKSQFQEESRTMLQSNLNQKSTRGLSHELRAPTDDNVAVERHRPSFTFQKMGTIHDDWKPASKETEAWPQEMKDEKERDNKRPLQSSLGKTETTRQTRKRLPIGSETESDSEEPVTQQRAGRRPPAKRRNAATAAAAAAGSETESDNDDEAKAPTVKSSSFRLNPSRAAKRHAFVGSDTESDEEPSSSAKPQRPPLDLLPKGKPSDLKNILKNVTFTISGLQNPHRSDIRDKAIAMGATFEPNITRRVGYLLCPFPNTPKYDEMERKGGKIVKPEWIEDCYRQKRLVPEERFYLGVTSDPQQRMLRFNTTTATSTSSPSASSGGGRAHSHGSPSSTSAAMTTSPYFGQKPSSPSRTPTKPAAKYDANGDSGSETEEEDEPSPSQKISFGRRNLAPEFDRKKPPSSTTTTTTTTAKTTTAKKDLPALPEFLSDCRVFLYNVSDEYQKELRRIVIVNGGMLHQQVRPNTTHFCTDESEWDEMFDKALGENAEVHFVKTAWLVQSGHEGRRLPENDPAFQIRYR